MARLVLYTETAEDIASAFPGAAKVEMRSFPDGESYARIPENCKGKDVLVLHRCYPNINENLIKLLQITAAARSQSPKSLRVFVPYLPYARMDKTVKEGEAISADIVCSLLKSVGCTELITVDCHFIKEGAGNFERAGLKIKNLTAADALLAYLKPKAPNAVTISPDAGASYMSSHAEGGQSMKKVRADYDAGSSSAYRKIEKLEAGFDVKGKGVIIIDDMVSTGSTMIKAVKVLREEGAGKVHCATTHGLFLNDALAKLKAAGASEVICTDSIPSPAAKVSVAKLLSGAV